MSYEKEFKAAMSRTSQWKLGSFSPAESGTGLSVEQRNELEAANHIPFEERVGKVMSVNFGDFHYILKSFGITDAVLTIGNVSRYGEMRYPVTAGHLKKILKHKSGEENSDRYHLWTTLPDGTIIDSVMLAALYLEGEADINPAIPSERALYGHPDKLPFGLKYHPLVVGVEFFVASDTIDREAMEYIMSEAPA